MKVFSGCPRVKSKITTLEIEDMKLLPPGAGNPNYDPQLGGWSGIIIRMKDGTLYDFWISSEKTITAAVYKKWFAKWQRAKTKQENLTTLE